MSTFLDILIFLNYTFFAIVMSKIDIREKRLPNRYMYPAILVAFALLLIKSFVLQDFDLISKDLRSTLVFTLFFLLTAFIYPQGFGIGDVKGVLLLGLSISILGNQALLISLSMSFLFSSIYIIYLRLIKRRAIANLAFGPFLFAPGVVLLGVNLFI